MYLTRTLSNYPCRERKDFKKNYNLLQKFIENIFVINI